MTFLIGFCDPFYVIEIFSPWIVWTGLATIVMVTELCLMLMFWLSAFDIVRSTDYWNEQACMPAMRGAAHCHHASSSIAATGAAGASIPARPAPVRSIPAHATLPPVLVHPQTRVLGCGFYTPKIIIVSVIWLFTIYTYLFVRLQTKKARLLSPPTLRIAAHRGASRRAWHLTAPLTLVLWQDPTFYAGENFDHFSFAKDMTFGGCVVYVVYMMILALLAIVKALTHQDMKIQFQFIFLMSLVAAIDAGVGLALGAFAPQVIHAAEFTTFFGSVCCYNWIMAYAYYPAGGSVETSGKGGHSEFHDEIEMPQTQNAMSGIGGALGDESLGEIRGPMSP